MKSFVLSLILGFVGYGILATIDWRIALGMFFIHWSINSDLVERLLK